MTTATTNEPVFLTLDMDPAEALQHLMAGRVQAPAYLDWNEAKLTAAKNLAAKHAAGNVRVTFEGAAGVVCLSGALKAAGRKGFDPNFSPAVWALVLDNAGAIAQTIIDHATDKHPTDAKRKTLSDDWSKWNKGGKKGTEPKPKFVEVAHPRAGKTAMDFSTDAERDMVLAKCRSWPSWVASSFVGNL